MSKKAKSKSVTFKVGDRVRLITKRHGVGSSNPVWGKFNGEKIVGTVDGVNRPWGNPVGVTWDNGELNSYKPRDLAKVRKPKVAKALAPATSPVIDPGAGYRLLSATEPLKPGDEFHSKQPAPLGTWIESDDDYVLGGARTNTLTYRRKIETPATEPMKAAPRSPEGTPPAGYRWLVEGEIVGAADLVHNSVTGNRGCPGAWEGHVVGLFANDFSSHPFIRPLATPTTSSGPATVTEPDRGLGFFNPADATARFTATFGNPSRTLEVLRSPAGIGIKATVNGVDQHIAFTSEAAEVLELALAVTK